MTWHCLSWLAAVALAAVATALHVRWWRWRLARPVAYDEVHRVATDDGCAFELRRLRPPAASADPPIILVHGVAINHRSFDPDVHHSLARTLRGRGRDVWLVTLRSGRSDLSAAEAGRVRFAAMAAHDLPQAVAQVRARAGAAQVDFVGFSMGGMLLYASLGRAVDPLHVRRAVIIGSPGRVGGHLPGLGWVRHLPPALVPGVPFRPLAALAAFASEWFETAIHRITMHLPNARAGYVRHSAAEAVQSVPAPLLVDLARWAYSDGVPRLDDGKDILAGLATIDVPALFIGGSVDRLCPPRALQVAYQAWGCNLGHTLKRLYPVGRAHGHACDYGHADLLIGARSETEVFAPVAEFLS